MFELVKGISDEGTFGTKPWFIFAVKPLSFTTTFVVASAAGWRIANRQQFLGFVLTAEEARIGLGFSSEIERETLSVVVPFATDLTFKIVSNSLEVNHTELHTREFAASSMEREISFANPPIASLFVKDYRLHLVFRFNAKLPVLLASPAFLSLQRKETIESDVLRCCLGPCHGRWGIIFFFVIGRRFFKMGTLSRVINVRKRFKLLHLVNSQRFFSLEWCQRFFNEIRFR